MDIGHGLLLAAFCVQLYDLGTIWIVQQVVYPVFGQVGEADYVTYHRFYVRRIPLPIIVPGFASFLLPVAVWATLPPTVPQALAALNVAMGVTGVLVTVAPEIPRHRRLERARDPRVIEELIRHNRPRTLSISASAALTLAMVLQAFAPV